MDDFGILLFKIVNQHGIVIVLALISSSQEKENVNEKWYNQLEKEVIQKLGFPNWDIIPYVDISVVVKSRQALEKYEEV